MFRTLAGVLLLTAPSLVGCGGGSDRPELVPVSGSVTFKGAPVEGATVTFYSEKSPRSAQGVTDASGNFKLTTYDTNDGAVAGEHTVSISKVNAADASQTITQANAEEMMKKNVGMMAGGKMADAKPELVLPAKYADAKTSGEKRTVVKGDANNFKFELTE